MADKPRGAMSKMAHTRYEKERLGKTPEGRAELARLEAERIASFKEMELAEETYQRRWGWLSRLLRPLIGWLYRDKWERENLEQAREDREWEEQKRKGLELVERWKKENEPPLK